MEGVYAGVYPGDYSYASGTKDDTKKDAAVDDNEVDSQPEGAFTLCDMALSRTTSKTIPLLVLSVNQGPEIEIADNALLTAQIDKLTITPYAQITDTDHNDIVQVNSFGVVSEAAASLLVTVITGRVSFITLSGLTILQGSGSLDRIISMRGPQNKVNDALGQMRYTCRSSDGCVAGLTDTITIVADDEGHSGKGGALTDTRVITVTMIDPI